MNNLTVLSSKQLESLRDEARTILAHSLPEIAAKLLDAADRASSPDDIRKVAQTIFDYAGLAPPREQAAEANTISLDVLKGALTAIAAIGGAETSSSSDQTGFVEADERNVTPVITSLDEAKRFYEQSEQQASTVDEPPTSSVDNNLTNGEQANSGDKGLPDGDGPEDEPTADLSYLEELE